MSEPKQRTSLFTWLVAGVMLTGVGYGISRSNEAQREAEAREAAKSPQQKALEAEARAKAERVSSAQYACGEFVTKSLHDPASAELGDFRKYPVIEGKSGMFTVQVSGRAKNGFNALRQISVKCITQRNERGDYALVKLME